MKKILIIMFAMFVGVLPIATLAGEVAATGGEAAVSVEWVGGYHCDYTGGSGGSS